VAVNETLVSTAEIVPGEKVLDVATGTGHAALAAARVGALVTGIDYVPALLDLARGRAAAERLDVGFVEAPAEQLPFEDGSFDVAISAIGVMFAADHDRAASELGRVVRGGGRIVLASWTRSGFVGGILGIVGKHVSPPPGAQSPVRWGEQDVVAELLGERVRDVQSSLHTVTQRFTSAEAFADLFLTYYGPTRAAAMRLDEAGRTALRADLVHHAEANARGHGTGAGVVLDWEYRIVTATRR
jgi:ubiquinone/menaquinone biosynthesis C-methylase UbiE